ncbi:hypothetical protein [Kocuria sp. SL71]|uniref:hypothetical protein n=1 Tax=Kocuria sp. SL71 TaxID=2995151 RepID=UPI0022769DA8|nr:hypothetical protein [Kocuria sp. SL71]MCY1684710.1 hypothetical protein [Kocuria sp. SL71]
MALPPLSRLYAPRTLAFAVASGAEEMIPYHRARGRTRAAIIAVPGLGYAGVVAWAMTRRGEADQAQGMPQLSVPGSSGKQGTRPKATPQLVGVTAAIAAVLSGSTALSMALDGAFERFLVRRGVRRPLLVMGATGLVVGWALEYFGADSDDEQPSQAGAGKHRDDDRPLDAPPRL